MRIPIPPVPLPDQVVEVAREYAEGRREPVEPLDAATVILLRGSEHGPAAYYLRRQVSMDFAGGMCVYPGGRVDPRDFDAEVGWEGPSPAEWAERLDVDEELARALVCAAVRETYEESGVLLAGPHADEVVADTTGEDWEVDRLALERHELAMTDFLVRRRLVLRTDLLGAWAAWTTPEFEPKRFRTWFFVALLPEGQRTRDVSTESSEVAWLPAREAVVGAERGEVLMMPPTYLTSLDVARYADADAVLAEAHRRSVAMHTPVVEPLEDGWTLSVPPEVRDLLREHQGRA